MIIAGLSGDSGKTIVSLSLAAALRRRGMTVAPFKKGPDYIDSAWLTVVAGCQCRNLDTWLVEASKVRDNFIAHAADADFAVIEGNRGLFDGIDVLGQNSTAGLAHLLQAPLVLVLNVTKATRTVAALVKGCQAFDPKLNLAGVILNKVAGARHEKIIRQSIEKYCALPVLGVIPKLGEDDTLIPGRHLGLVPPAEYMAEGNVAERLGKLAEKHIDIDAIIKAASQASPLESGRENHQSPTDKKVRIGYFSDSVFTFYYPENLEALERHGAELTPVSALADVCLPQIDALYIGGGFPETQAESLIRNRALMEAVKAAAEAGLPIYAECGGLIYLSRSISIGETNYPMAGVFPVDLAMQAKPVGHGYAELEADKGNPYFAAGTHIRGHEFHYSGVVSELPEKTGCFKMAKGVGLGNRRDGLSYRQTLACYTHIHADGVKSWAETLTAKAAEFSRRINENGGVHPALAVAALNR